MNTFDGQPESLEDLRNRLTASEQEREQLQTALEDAEQRIGSLASENAALQTKNATLFSENTRLRHLLFPSDPEKLAERASNGKPSPPVADLEGEVALLNEELQISIEELQVTAEELEEANAALRGANEYLEAQVTERTASLTQALAERDALIQRKDLLMREVDHRVKNSLQMVLSLLRIQTSKQTDSRTRQVLQTAGMRIQAIAQVHTMLYARSNAESVRFDDYLEEICTFLGATLGASERRRALLVEAAPVELPPDLAIPLALITTELVTNSFRHAFGGKPGTVWVQFHRKSDDMLELTVADDGRGLPADFDLHKAEGLGLQVVNAMVEQLGATFDISRQAGARFTLTLPAKERPV
jgi:two-component system, sensor histidine kinase PdtaS